MKFSIERMVKYIKSKLQKTPPKPLECPYCGGIEWHEGPSGGEATSIMCANESCQHWFTYHDAIIWEDLHETGPRF